MEENNDRIEILNRKLEFLLKRQDDFSREINNLKLEIKGLRQTSSPEVDENIKNSVNVPRESENRETVQSINDKYAAYRQSIRESQKATKHKDRTIDLSLEKFIGENLINKVGIIITIIGVAIGAKYSIDHQLISPLGRILLGYLMGAVLFGFGLKLREKYNSFSAVLISGAMAIMYFMTYFAYGFYSLIPQLVAFLLMVAFTVITVYAALIYNRQVIAHIGLVGAYAIPFILSEGSGQVVILFSYISIINAGILILSFRKYWKPLYYSAFGLTWLIFFSWYINQYQPLNHYTLSIVFNSVFFLIFYLTFIAYKFIRKEKFNIDDIFLLLANSFVYYGFGYSILDEHVVGQHFLGLFTLVNASIHFIVGASIYRKDLADKNLYYLVIGLALIFITIAIPVQLDNNWVTLLWAGEAALLFWIGRTKKVGEYEMMAYPLMILAFISLMQDWSMGYNSYIPDSPDTRVVPILNIHFLTSLLFLAAYGSIIILKQKYPISTITEKQRSFAQTMAVVIPVIFGVALYNSFRLEIAVYWDQLYSDSWIENLKGDVYGGRNNDDYKWFKIVWTLNYTLLFISALTWLNFKKIRDKQLEWVSAGLIVFGMALYLTAGLYYLSELRISYLNNYLAQYYQRTAFNIGIRYVSYIFAALTLFSGYRYIIQRSANHSLKLSFDLLLSISVIWIASSELLNLMDIAGSAQSYKLGLSLLWGSYSLLLIAFGIWKKKSHLRIAAIALFGITLIKLFFYDISHLDTISKTIVFVCLGVLLLIISFMYNKFKAIIS